MENALHKKIIDMYNRGATVLYLARRFNLAPSELEDIIPGASEKHPEPESDIGGY